MGLEESEVLVDVWPSESGNYTLVLVDITKSGKTTPHMACWKAYSHFGVLQFLLESLGIAYKTRNISKIKSIPVQAPEPNGQDYHTFGMGHLEVILGKDNPYANAVGYSQTYGIMLTEPGQMVKVIASHRKQGIQLPDYRVLVRGREVYGPESIE